MKKKAISMLLSFVLAMSLLPAGALAADAPGQIGSICIPAFDDVVSGAWYYNAVTKAAQNGLITGVTATRFEPDAPMTRAMLVMALNRLAGSPAAKKATAFSDVAATAWYYNAVDWAAANGIVTGNDGAFMPDVAVTREQTAAILQRFAKYQGRSTGNAANLSGFADASTISGWANGALGWAVSAGLISGTGSGTLQPSASATRAQLAVILSRYMNAATLEKRTSAYISQFMTDNFDSFLKDCDESLQKTLTSDQLRLGWNTLLQSIGTPKGTPASVYSRWQGYDIVVSAVECTLYKINVTVTYDNDGKIIGIFSTLAPKAPPVAQLSDKWTEVPVSVGERKLPGLLTLPKGVEKPPVVVLVQGSGASDMNESFGTAPNRPFEDIAHGLAGQGVATLRYNKRTYEYPSEASVSATIQYEILDDASSAVKLLSSDGRVDANRIYLLGHSLGGMMAPKITADNPQIKGFVSLAGSLRSLLDIMLDQNKAMLAANTTLTEQQKTAALAQTEAEIAKTKTLDDGGTGYILGAPTGYWKSLNAIDGKSIVQTLKVPMLILQGSADFQVYPDKDYKLWQDTLAGRTNVTFKLYDGLSHMFMPNQVSSSGAPDTSLYNAPNCVDAKVISDIATWVKGQ